MSPSDFPSASHIEGATRRVVVVLGMHRSGTSAVAGSLHQLGVDFGPRLMPPTSANERGYFEHIDIVNLHDRLLLALDSSWDETRPLPDGWWLDESRLGSHRAELLSILQRDFGNAPLWGLKDPRLCKLLPWWEPVWRALRTQPLYVIVLRDPEEIASSLVRRDGFSAAKSYLLWLQYLLEAERWTRDQPRVFLDFGDFLTHPAQQLAAIGEELGCSWPAETDGTEADAAPFLDPALRHALPAASGASVSTWVERVATTLQVGLRGREYEAQLRAGMDDERRRLAEAAELFGPLLLHSVSDLRLQLCAQREQGRWYAEEWQKARGREGALKERLAREKEKTQALKSRIVEKDNILSSMRMNVLSKTIKMAIGPQKSRFAKILRWFPFSRRS